MILLVTIFTHTHICIFTVLITIITIIIIVTTSVYFVLSILKVIFLWLTGISVIIISWIIIYIPVPSQILMYKISKYLIFTSFNNHNESIEFCLFKNCINLWDNFLCSKIMSIIWYLLISYYNFFRSYSNICIWESISHLWKKKLNVFCR